jgi:hypothetical protein
MSEEPDKPAVDAPGDEHPLSLLLFSWMRGRGFDRFLLACVSALCAVLAVLDLLVPRHKAAALDGLPLFFAVFGFVAFGFAVLSGWPLGRLLRRPENYYDKHATASETERRDV